MPFTIVKGDIDLYASVIWERAFCDRKLKSVCFCWVGKLVDVVIV